MTRSITRWSVGLLLLVALSVFAAGGCGCDDDDDDGGHDDGTPPTATIEPEAGLFNTPVEVTITAEDDRTTDPYILFTLDGSEPSTDKTAGGTIRAISPVTLTLSQNTTVTYLAMDGSGNAGEIAVAEYKIDSLPPAVTAKPASGVYGATQSVTLAAYDDNGGTITIYYTLDGTDPEIGGSTEGSTLIGTAPVTGIEIAAPTEIRYLAVDAAGNAGEIGSATYVIDGTLPDVIAEPAGRVFGGEIEITLTATDDLTTAPQILYTLDGTEPSLDSSTTYRAASPVVLTATQTTTIIYTAVDEAGNSPTPKVDLYTLDSSPPVGSVSAAGGVYPDVLSLTLSATDNYSAAPLIYYTLNGAEPYPGQDGTLFGPSPIEGIAVTADTVLKFYAMDEVGNREATHTENYRIDSLGPTVAASVPGGIYTAAQTVTLTAADDLPGALTIYYTTDGSTPVPGGAGTVAGLSPVAGIVIDAATTLSFFARDAAGNDGPLGVEVYVIDAQAPTVAAAPTGDLYNAAPTVTITATDNVSAAPVIYYTLDGSVPEPGAPGTYQGVSPVTGLVIPASATLLFYAVDEAGNESALGDEEYLIDSLPPSVTFDPAGGYVSHAFWATVTATDDLAAQCTIYYTTDGNDPVVGSSPQSPSPLEVYVSGALTLKVVAVDEAGNGSGVLTQVYGLDTTPPVTTANPLGGVYATPQTITLTATDAHTAHPRLYYTRDGSIPIPGSTWTYSGLSPVTGITFQAGATFVLRFMAVDDAGNIESVKTEVYNPTMPSSSAYPPGSTAIGCLSIAIIGSDPYDPTPTIFYRLRHNGGSWSAYTSGPSPYVVSLCGDNNYVNGADTWNLEYYAINQWLVAQSPHKTETYLLY